MHVVRHHVWLHIFCGLLLTTLCGKRTADTKITITATTSLIESIVSEIGNEKVAVVTLVPASMCPGHFDAKASTVIDVANSKAVINHGWEQWFDDLIKIGRYRIKTYTLPVKENLMIPLMHKRASEYVATILCTLDVKHRDYYQNNCAQYIAKIDSFEKHILEEQQIFQDVPVICSSLQEPFLKWLGFDVVTTYGRAEELTPQTLSGIILKARKTGALIVVDNLQSGEEAGRIIADELKARHVTLTNFPLNGSYLDAVADNVAALREILE